MNYIYLNRSNATSKNIVAQELSINDTWYTGVPQIEIVKTKYKVGDEVLVEILTFDQPIADEFFYLSTKEISKNDGTVLSMETYHPNDKIYERVHYSKGIAQYVQLYDMEGVETGSIHLYENQIVYVVDNKQVSDHTFWQNSCEVFQNNTYIYSFTSEYCIEFKC